MPEHGPNSWTPDQWNKFLVYGVALPVLLAGSVLALIGRDDGENNNPEPQIEIVSGIKAQVEAKYIKDGVHYVEVEQCNKNNKAENPGKLKGHAYDPALGMVAVGCAFQRIPIEEKSYKKAVKGGEMIWSGKKNEPIIITG